MANTNVGAAEPRFETPPVGQELSEISHISKPGNQQEWSNLDQQSQNERDPRYNTVNDDLTNQNTTSNHRSISQVFNHELETPCNKKEKDLDGDGDDSKANKNQDFHATNLESKIEKVIGTQFEFHDKKYIFAARSLFCFYGSCWLRQNVVKLVTWKMFDHFITLVILANSITLGMADYSHRITKEEDYDTSWNDNMDIAGYVMSVIFLLECILKIIAFGFIVHKNAYLRNSWNWLDFFVVLVSLLDFFPSLEQYSSLKVFRTLRILRPLRAINKIERMKEIINTLLASIPGLLNVMFFLFFVSSVFGILGVHQFAGAQFNRCRTTEEPIELTYWPIDESIDQLCNDNSVCTALSGGTQSWCKAPLDGGLEFSIDNPNNNEELFFNIVGFEVYMKSMATIFQAITLEGWSIMMYNFSDGDSAPMSVIYFGSLVIFGAFFALNLLLAQIMFSFSAEKELQKQRKELGMDGDESEGEEHQVEHKPFDLDKMLKEHLQKLEAKANQPEILVDHMNSSQGNTNSMIECKTPAKIDNYSAMKIEAESVQISPDGASSKKQVTGLPTIEDTSHIDMPPQLPYDQKTGKSMRMTYETNFGQMKNADSDQSEEEEIKGSGAKRINEVPVDFQPIREVSLNMIDELLDEKPVQEEKQKSEQENSVETEIEGETEAEKKTRDEASNSNLVRRCIFSVVTHSIFNFFVFVLIIANTVVLASDGYPISVAASERLSLYNQIFTILFGAEMILKMFGLGCKNYLNDAYNFFDAVIVTLSVVDWVLTDSINPEDLGSAAEILKALKALRMLRVIKLARQIPDVQDILVTTAKSLKDVALFSVLVLLYLYICALLGMELFAYYCNFNENGDIVTDYFAAKEAGQKMEPPRSNFDNVGMALTSVFILVLGEDWPFIMYDHVRVYGVGTTVGAAIQFYFVLVLAVGNLILLSLFTALLLENFEDADAKEEKLKQKEKEAADLSLVKLPTEDKKLLHWTVRIKLSWSRFKFSFVACFGTSYAKRKMKRQAEQEQRALIETERVNDQKVYPIKNLEEPTFKLTLDSPPPTLPVKRVESEENIKTSQNADAIPSAKSSKKTLRKVGTENYEEGTINPLNVMKVEEIGDYQNEPRTDVKRVKERLSGILTPADSPKGSSRDGTPKGQSKEQQVMRRDSIRELFMDSAKDNFKKSATFKNQNSEQAGSKSSTAKKLAQSASSIGNKSGGSTLQHTIALQLRKAHTKKLEEEKEKLFGNACMCFSPTNSIRRFCNKLINHKSFDWVIMFFIFVSTILLCMESPMYNPDSEYMNVLGRIDIAMTIIFVVEMLIKICSMGFVKNGAGSYLLEPWNILDFIIVLCSLVSLLLSTWIDIAYLKVFRMLRILRPLRLINRQKQLKLAITSLIKSIPDIVQLLLIVQFFIFLIGILCQTLWAGTFWHCVTDHIPFDGFVDLINNSDDCLNYGGEWVNNDFNFDNILNSMITLSTISSTEGWIDVMWNSVDANGRGNVPVRDNQPIYIILYIFLICMICLLFVNLFVGVVIDTFNNEKESLLKNNLLNDDSRNFISMQIMAYNSKPLVQVEVKGNCFKRFLIRVTQHSYFDCFITICIVLNTIMLAVYFYGMDESLVDNFQIINYIFMVIFTVEAVMKISAMGCDYFDNRWNVFDFIVVVGTILVLIISQLPDVGVDLSAQMTIGRVLRILRVLRIIKRAEKLNMIFETIVESLPAMGSLGGILLLFLFLFAILGNQLFAFTMLEAQLEMNRHANFQTFYSSFLLLFRCATGEAWNSIMMDTMRTNTILFQCDNNATYESVMANNGIANGCGKPIIAAIYFLIFFYVVSQIFLNLFIAIVVDTFAGQALAHGLPVKQRDVDIFIECWQKYDPRRTGFIPIKALSEFMTDLIKTDADWFKHNKSELNSKTKVDYFIAVMEFPTHKQLKCYQYYDVLQALVDNACSINYFQTLYGDELIVDLKKKVKVEAMWIKQTLLNPEEISCKTFAALKFYSSIFFDQIKEDQYSEDKNTVDLIMQLRDVSADVEEHYGEERDMRAHVHKEYENEEGKAPYHSGHVDVVRKLMDAWIEHKERSKGEAVGKLQSDEWDISTGPVIKETEKKKDPRKKFSKAPSLEGPSMPPIEEEVEVLQEDTYAKQDLNKEMNIVQNLSQEQGPNASQVLNEILMAEESREMQPSGELQNYDER